MRKCVILQAEAIHEIITPGIIKVLNELSFKPVLYFNIECSIRRGDFFKYCTDLEFELNEIALVGRQAWLDLQNEIKAQSPEFLLVNTLQKNDRIEWYNELDLPTIGIVHNIHKFLETDFAFEFIAKKNVHIFTIASHVSLYMRNKIGFDKTNVDSFVPAYLKPISNSKRKYKQDGKIRLAIIGGINNIRNRGFDSLLNELKENKEDYKGFEFVICGGGADRERLEKFVDQYELNDFFDFVEVSEESHYVMYDNYYKSIEDSDFLITLFPKADIKYFKFKATASIMTALSLDLPIMTDTIARCIYNVPCISYSNDEYSEIFRTLKSFTEASYNELRSETIKYKELAVSRGVKSFEIAIKNILNT